MKNKSTRNNKLIAALVSIVLGLMFIIFKGEVINIAMTIIGAVAIIMAIIDFVHKETVPGVLKAIIGVCVIVFGWVFVDIALYVIAGILILLGITQIVSAVKNADNVGSFQKVAGFIIPVASLASGICLFFNQGGTISWIFTAAGILLMVQGVLGLINSKE